MPETILVLGAGSGIARALITQYAQAGHRILLAGRHTAELERIAADTALRHPGAQTQVLAFDAEAIPGHAEWVAALLKKEPRLDQVALCFGYLPDPAGARQNHQEAARTVTVNFTGAVSILECLAPVFEARKKGSIIAISSVAGDRGRQSNYHYGSAKAGLSAYLQGLRQRLCPAGVQVITVKPGFIKTAMTRGMRGGLLASTPEVVAKDILKAQRKKRDVVYTPWFWRWIMLIIIHIPEGIFKRLRIG
jgi:short-subunit dehydrogenase